jgi:Leucine-rich repeat (LRR) protein
MSAKYQNRSDLNAALNEAVERRKDQQKNLVDPKQRWKQGQESARRKRTMLVALATLPTAVLAVVWGLWYMGIIRFGPPGPLADALASPASTEVLRLDGANLGHYPEEIGVVSGLKELNLNNNGISSLPPSVAGLKKLQILSLSYNHLTTLPPEIGKLEKLRELHLKNNDLTSLPEQIVALGDLETLDLSNNQLGELPAKLGKLKHLKTLRLKGNHISRLPAGLEKLSHLRELDLSGNPLKTLPDPSRLPDLQRLNVRRTGIPPSAIESFKARLTKVSVMQ